MEKLKYVVVEKEKNDDRKEVWIRVKGPAIDKVADDDAWPVAVWGPRYVAEIYADKLDEENRDVIKAILRDVFGGDPPMDKVRANMFYWGREAVIDITAPHPSIW